MTFRRNVNNSVFHSVGFRAKENVFAEILLHNFIQKKSVAEAHWILVETYSDRALSETTRRDWFGHFKNNDFDVEDKECSGAPKKFEDEKLEALLHEDSGQIQAEHTELFGVDYTTVLKRLKELRMIQKQGNWRVNNRKGKVYCIVSWPAMKNGYTTKTLSIEDRGVNPAMHQHWRQNRISMVRNFRSAFGGIRLV